MKASITIEASLVYPIVICCTVFIIFYSFYAHDRLSCKAHAYKSLVAGHYSSSSVSASAIQQQLNDICLLSGPYIVSYDATKECITITDRKNSSLKVSFTGYERCDFIRKYSMLLDIIIRKDN